MEGLSFCKVKELVEARGGDGSKTGWYLQQFLKLSYGLIYKEEYYIVWDSDTVPVKEVELFSKDIPYFDMKAEYHKPYFDTIENLFYGKYHKILKGSFISEHMVLGQLM